MKIYLIRHGITRAAAESIYCGSSDLPLTEKGREDLARKKTVTAYPDAEGRKLYTSGLIRTKQTAEILFPGAEYEADEAFNEMDFGEFELRKYYNDLENDPAYIKWAGENNESNICPHGESSVMMKQRVFAGFGKVLADGTDSIIVCHGGPIAALFIKYNPDSGLNYYEIQPKHGEGYCMEFEDGLMTGCTKLAEK